MTDIQILGGRLQPSFPLLRVMLRTPNKIFPTRRCLIRRKGRPVPAAREQQFFPELAEAAELPARPAMLRTPNKIFLTRRCLIRRKDRPVPAAREQQFFPEGAEAAELPARPAMLRTPNKTCRLQCCSIHTKDKSVPVGLELRLQARHKTDKTYLPRCLLIRRQNTLLMIRLKAEPRLSAGAERIHSQNRKHS